MSCRVRFCMRVAVVWVCVFLLSLIVIRIRPAHTQSQSRHTHDIRSLYILSACSFSRSRSASGLYIDRCIHNSQYTHLQTTARRAVRARRAAWCRPRLLSPRRGPRRRCRPRLLWRISTRWRRDGLVTCCVSFVGWGGAGREGRKAVGRERVHESCDLFSFHSPIFHQPDMFSLSLLSARV